MSISIFISHSSADIELARGLSALFQKAFRFPGDKILCSSVDGHRLAGGDRTDEVLRRELLEAEVFVGLITPASIRSAYVLFELGARWGSARRITPLLAGGASVDNLKTPLGNLNGLNAYSRAELLQLLDEVEDTLKVDCEPRGVLAADIETVLKLAGPKDHPYSAVRQICNKWMEDDEEPMFGDIWILPPFLEPGDEVLAFIDGTKYETGLAGLAILPTGIAWRNRSRDRVGRMTWSDLAKAKTTTTKSDMLKIGRAETIDLSRTTYRAKAVADLLHRIVRSRRARPRRA